MARMSIKAPDSLIASLQSLQSDIGKVAEYAVRAGAELLADDVRARLEGNLTGSEHSTGDLLQSLGITPVKTDENGTVDAKVGFHGYDRKGVSNVLKARVMESGSTKQRKKPFFRTAVNRCRKKIPAEMQRIISIRIKK